MPIKVCQINWKPWYKRGDEGNCYEYELWNKESRNEAKYKSEYWQVWWKKWI